MDKPNTNKSHAYAFQYDGLEIAEVDEDGSNVIRAVQKWPDALWVQGLGEEPAPANTIRTGNTDDGKVANPSSHQTSIAHNLSQADIWMHIKWLRWIGCGLLITLVLTGCFMFLSNRSAYILHLTSHDEAILEDLFSWDAKVQEEFSSESVLLSSPMGTIIGMHSFCVLLGILLVLYAARLGALSDNFLVFLGTGSAALSVLGSVGLLALALSTFLDVEYFSYSLLRTFISFQWTGWFCALICCSFWFLTPFPLIISTVMLITVVLEVILCLGFIPIKFLIGTCTITCLFVVAHSSTVCSDARTVQVINSRPIDASKVHCE